MVAVGGPVGEGQFKLVRFEIDPDGRLNGNPGKPVIALTAKQVELSECPFESVDPWRTRNRRGELSVSEGGGQTVGKVFGNADAEVTLLEGNFITKSSGRLEFRH